MTVKLVVLTQDAEEEALLRRYWAMNEQGDFLERVKDLLPFRQVKQAGALAIALRRWCKVFDENQTCNLCTGLIEIRTRTEAKKFAQRAMRPCTSCQAVIDAEHREAQSRADEELKRRLQVYIQEQASYRADYSSVPDDIAVMLLALDSAIAPRLATGAFTVQDCKGLAPLHVSHFIDRLVDARVLREEPTKAPRGTYYLKGGELWVHGDQRVYGLVPDQRLSTREELVSAFQDRDFFDGPALYSLWLDYAEADCMCYFHAHSRIYSHDLYEHEVVEVKSILRDALKRYSVAQMWFVIWKVVKDAASLANREYYNRAKAAATIPGKVRRYLERVQKESLRVRHWDRPESQPAGTLGMVFMELFGLDEHSTGEEAHQVFSQLGVNPLPTPEAQFCSAAERWMTTALQGEQAGAVVVALADLIRTGLTTEDALGQLIERQDSGF